MFVVVAMTGSLDCDAGETGVDGARILPAPLGTGQGISVPEAQGAAATGAASGSTVGPMWFCDECGASVGHGNVLAGEPPGCLEHGPRWRLIRNAPCAGVVIVKDDRVLLSRRAKPPFEGYWEVPGGFVERGEHPTQAARREVLEELGIDVVLTGLLGIYLESSSGDEPLQVTVYEATTEATEASPDPTEVSGWAWFTREDLPTEMAGRHRLRLDDWLAGRTVPLPADGL